MNSPMRIGLAAAALVVAALVGYQLLSGPNIAGPGPSNLTPIELPSTVPLPAGSPVELPSAAPLAAGTYFIRNPYTDDDPVRSCDSGCADYTRIVFTLPDGWATTDGFVHKEFGQAGEVAFKAWTPGEIYLDPCHWQESSTGPISHADDSSGAIVVVDQFPLLNQVGTSASGPTNVVLGGQRSLRIDVSIPAELDIATCDRGEFRSWTEWDVVDGANSHHASGQIDVVYFVDVDRRTLFVDVSYLPGASEADLAEMAAILSSMVIER